MFLLIICKALGYARWNSRAAAGPCFEVPSVNRVQWRNVSREYVGGSHCILHPLRIDGRDAR